jgi:UDP-N-acetylmuramoyl-tripeptide--D-alanyl-D-alanine ligase
MKPINFKQLLNWLPHATLKASTHLHLKRSTCYGVNTDTRTLRAGNVFLALKGERFDGHRFLDFANRHRAGAMVVNYDSAELLRGNRLEVPLILVPDTGKALQALAKGYRQQFDIPLVIVVGSNGKTTAKEMIHSIFKMHCAQLGNDRAAHCTVGNFNNEIGLPLTLLRLNDHHRYSTVELGMNHPGETAVLAAIAAPTVALINNAQREHQEFMQTVEAVAIEHADVIAALTEGGISVIPAQDTYVQVWRRAAQAANKCVIDFALHSEQDQTQAAVTGTRIENGLSQTLQVQTPQGAATIALNTAGEHNARNALAAIAVATAASIPLASIVAGLQAFEPVKGRMQQHRVGELTVIDDSYNANPDSVAAAIRVLAPLGQRSVLVLGDMGEVGDQGATFHTEAGADAAAQGVGALYALGDLCQHAYTAFKTSGKPCQHFADAAALNTFLLSSGALSAGSTVLVKGSRFMRMDLTVDALLGRSESASGGH